MLLKCISYCFENHYPAYGVIYTFPLDVNAINS
jgi:hypothetical protein